MDVFMRSSSGGLAVLGLLGRKRKTDDTHSNGTLRFAWHFRPLTPRTIGTRVLRTVELEDFRVIFFSSVVKNSYCG